MRLLDMLIIGGVLLALSGCQEAPALSNAEVQKMRGMFPGMTTRCLNLIRQKGLVAMPDRADQCFKMTAPQRFKGVWRREFELSRFCPVSTSTCGHAYTGNEIWLSFGDNVAKEMPARNGLYSIEFVGRKTLLRGMFGHMGTFGHEVLVDRLIAVKALKYSELSN